MKILKFLGLLLIGFVLLFFVMGLVKPSVDYGHTITVDKPLKEAWAVHQDVSKYDQWLEGFKSIKLISGKKGVPGSTYKVVVNPGEGQPDFEMIETVVEYKKFDLVNLSFDSDMMVFNQTTSFAENNGKTSITTDSKVNAKGIIMRSMFAIMETFAGSFQKQEEKNLESLKALINNNEQDYFPAPIEIQTEPQIAM